VAIAGDQGYAAMIATAGACLGEILPAFHVDLIVIVTLRLAGAAMESVPEIGEAEDA